jgi:hypothetical protein
MLGAALAGCIVMGPAAEIEPNSLEFVAVLGGENPPGKVVEITDPLDSTPPYEATTTSDWLTVTHWCNPLLGMPSYEWVWGKWTVSVSTEGLPEGEHHAEVEITDANGLLVATVPVTLTVYLEDCIVFPNMDCFEAVGVVEAASQKWIDGSGGKVTHVLAGEDGPKLRLKPMSQETADALAFYEGREVVVSGSLPHLGASWDSDGPVPPVGEVVTIEPVAVSIEAFGCPIPVSQVPGLTGWATDSIPPSVTHAFLEAFEMPPQPWPPGYFPELPAFPYRLRHFLQPAGGATDLTSYQGLTVRVEGDLVGLRAADPRVIRVRIVEDASEALLDRVSGAVGKIMQTTSPYAPAGATHELYLPSWGMAAVIVTEFFLSGNSPVDLIGLEGEWVEVSGEVTDDSGLDILTLSIDSATVLSGQTARHDRVWCLYGEVEAVTPGDYFTPSAATHNLIKDFGPYLPAFWTAAHLRNLDPGLLEQWEGWPVYIEGTVESWITWEGDQSFGTLVNVSGITPCLPPLVLDP